MAKATAQQIVGYSKQRNHADFYPTPPNASEALMLDLEEVIYDA